jgi:hypothetical protein
MKYRYAFLAALAVAATAASTSTLAQQPPRPGQYRGGSPPEHMPPAMLPRDYQRGERIDPEFRNRQFVVDDWRQHGLKPPPRGYHWVGLTGRYYLVRSSTWTVERLGP